MPTLTVVIPAKNEEAMLSTLLTSLQEQTRPADEMILADAKSTDKTREIATAFGARIVDGGLPGPGRNAGARAATSEMILFLDADVRLPTRDFLERAMRECEERNFDVATADVWLENGAWYDKAGHAFYNAYARLWGSIRPHAPGFCIFVRKKLHEKIGGFDETVTFCEDHEYVGRAAKQGRFGFLDTVRIAVTTRRQERDGRMRMACTYILAELHLLFLGPIRHHGFRYGFGYTQKDEEADGIL
ncbi:glycosyltransferase [bacterium]|nr:glycosyltransferase [bacterium]